MESYGKMGQDVDFRLLHFRTYGAEWIKEKAKLSPDSYVQMALQLAYYKLYHTGTLPRNRAWAWKLSRNAQRSKVADATALLQGRPRTRLARRGSSTTGVQRPCVRSAPSRSSGPRP